MVPAELYLLRSSFRSSHSHRELSAQAHFLRKMPQLAARFLSGALLDLI
jgi:hypothetical protein